jgi:hypothetical protein
MTNQTESQRLRDAADAARKAAQVARDAAWEAARAARKAAGGETYEFTSDEASRITAAIRARGEV